MSDTTTTGSRIIGTLRAADDPAADTGTVRMHDRFDTTIDDLWSAITDRDRAARWIGELDGDLSLGGTFHARLTSHWEGSARVDECEAPRRVLVTMRPGEPDETVFEAWLTEEEGGTDLVIEERGLPLDQIFAHGAGWQAHIEDLAAHVAGRAPAPWEQRWHELSSFYAAMAAGIDRAGRS
jgi:uncharacterized protein YndB with AHSA1/START domain